MIVRDQAPPCGGTEVADARHVAALFEALETSGIGYAVLHGAQDIPDHVDSDIDMIVAPHALTDLTCLLAEFAHSRDGVLCQVIRHEATARYHVLALPAPDGRPSFVKVDASTDFRRDGRVFFTGPFLLCDTRMEGRVRSVSVGKEFAAYLAKCILKGRLSGAHMDSLSVLWRRDGAACVLSCREYLSPRDISVIEDAMEGADAAASITMLLGLRGSVLAGASRRHPLLALMMPFQNLVRAADRVVRRTGFQVALLGPDGVGKSTVLRQLPGLLGPAFRRVEYLHLRPGLLPARTRPATFGSALPYGDVAYPVIRSLAKLAYLLTDYVVGYLVKVWPSLVASTLQMCDRYFLDLLADPRRYRYGGPRWALSIAEALVPGPDLYIVLLAPAHTVHRRKQEVTPQESELQCSRYAGLADGYRALSVVDAGQMPQVVAREVAWACLRAMSRRCVNRP